MFSAFALLVSFLLGGVTLLPLLLAVVLGFLYYTSPIVHLPRKTGLPPLRTVSDDEAEPVTIYRAGWLTVRRTYEPLLDTNGTYVGMVVSGYRSFMDNRSRDPRRSKPKDQFYGVLKQNVLFLYDNEEQADCWAAVEVSQHDVVIYPEGNLDGELFVKRNAIALKPRSVEDDSAAAAHTASDEATHDMDPSTPLPWFIFAKVNSDKEDWFHSLVQSSKLASPTTASTLEKDRSLFDPEDMASLIDGIDAQPDSIPMRWFNALLGRIFLAVYRTSTLEEYITSRIVRKLKRVKTPSILSEIQVREVNVGSAVPFFSKPMLKELTADGDASMEVHVSYIGDLRITIETVATINLGSRFKPYSVRLVLAVVLKEIEGTLLLKVKRPPSNRVWFGFSSMPRMVLNVEPVVSTRQIKWSMITSPIESRIREVIMESIVVPHMDDLSFFNSRPFATRGGIWGDALRKEQNLAAPVGAPLDDSATVGTSETPEVEEVTGEPVPSVTGQNGVGSATSATETSTGTARSRMSRRTEDEHERGRTGASSIKSNSSSSSLSNFSLSSWRESRNSVATASTSPTSAATGAGDKRRSWFGPSRSSTSGSAASIPNSSTSSLPRASTFDTAPSSAAETAHPKTTSAEDSASRLRDLLAKRAHSREREKETRASTPSIKEDDQAEESAALEAAPKLSALSLTAPAPSSISTSSNSSSLHEDLLAVPSASSAHTSPSSLLPNKPISESPNGSVEALNEQLAQSTPARLPTSQSSPSLSSSAEPSSSAPTPATALPPATLPSRPSFTKGPPGTPPPLPRRDQAHQSTQSADFSSTTSSLLSSWRTKAADKQALAAGVAQAKDTMKRWGATWNARKAADEDAFSGERDPGVLASSPPQDGGRSLSTSREREAVPSGSDGASNAESYRDYRAKKSLELSAGDAATASGAVAIGGESGRRTRESSGASASPTRSSARTPRPSLSSSPSAGHFTPAAPSPTTKLSTAPTFASGSPTVKAPSTKSASVPAPPARAYKPATMMAIPGIRDESKRNAVASDHVSAEEVNREGTSPSKTEEMRRESPRPPPAIIADPAPASLPIVDSLAPLPSPPLLPPPPPPRPVISTAEEGPTLAARPVPPPPPPRPTVVETDRVEPRPPVLPPRPADPSREAHLTTPPGATVPSVSVSAGESKPRQVEQDDGADEEGWGLRDDEETTKEDVGHDEVVA